MSVLAVAVRPTMPVTVHPDSHRSLTWIDDVLADSFPASDPPSWTPGMARPAPRPAPAVAPHRPPRALFVSYVDDERELSGADSAPRGSACARLPTRRAPSTRARVATSSCAPPVSVRRTDC